MLSSFILSMVMSSTAIISDSNTLDIQEPVKAQNVVHIKSTLRTKEIAKKRRRVRI